MSISTPGVGGPPYRRRNNSRGWLWLSKFYLTRFDKDAVGHFACKVFDALDCAIVLAVCFEELDTDPFAWREGGCAVETDCTAPRRYVYDGPESDDWWGHPAPPAA